MTMDDPNADIIGRSYRGSLYPERTYNVTATAEWSSQYVVLRVEEDGQDPYHACLPAGVARRAIELQA